MECKTALICIRRAHLREMSELSDESVHCRATSSPRFGLLSQRDRASRLGWRPTCEHSWGDGNARSASKRTTLAPSNVYRPVRATSSTPSALFRYSNCARVAAKQSHSGKEPGTLRFPRNRIDPAGKPISHWFLQDGCDRPKHSSGLRLTEESIFRFSPERQLCDCAACARELLSRSHRRIGLACSQSSRIAIVRRSTSGGRGSLF